MSPELVGAFEQQWPDVASRLHALLAGKNVPASKRDDVVQETGLRLFGMWEKVDRARPVWPLVVTIALNLLRDEARRHPEREVLGTVPDVPTSHDVEHEGLARLELERVCQAMERLSPAHRDVLLDEITPHPEVPKAARNATKMMRLRARRALATLLETAVLRAGLIGVKIRQSLGFNDPFLPLRMGGAEGGALPAAALAFAALLFGTVQVQPESVARASEAPDPVALAPWDATHGATSSGIGGETYTDQLVAAVQTLRARALSDDARNAEDADGKRKARTKAKGDGARDRKRSRGEKPDWSPSPPEESSPLEVPLPVGKAHLGGGVGVGAVGAEVGNREGNPAPACLAGVEPASLGCGSPPPEKASVEAGAEAEANGQTVRVEVDEEISTDVV